MLLPSFWYATAIGDHHELQPMVGRQALASVACGSGEQSISLGAMSSQGGRRQVPTDLAPAGDDGTFLQECQVDEQHGSLLPAPYRSRTPLLNLNHFTVPCRRSIGDKAHDGGCPALAADTGNPNNRVADHIAERSGISLRLTAKSVGYCRRIQIATATTPIKNAAPTPTAIIDAA